MQITYHTDSGHGWLQTSNSLIAELGIEDKISSYSYKDFTAVYLEEDMDAGTFIDALKKRDPNIELTFNEKFQENSFIRSLPSYQ